jgi:hypothetical protein
MTFTPRSIAALIVAASFAAGLNVYATVCHARHHRALALGRPSPANSARSPTPGSSPSASPALRRRGLRRQGSRFDLIWNALHTFIRVPVAALLAYQAASRSSRPRCNCSPPVAGAAIAALAHTSKTAARVLVTPSPSPSPTSRSQRRRRRAAISLTWLATHHPYIAAGIACVGIVVLLFSLRWIAVRLKRLFRRRQRRKAEPLSDHHKIIRACPKAALDTYRVVRT